jgi:hypothetical protein
VLDHHQRYKQNCFYSDTLVKYSEILKFYTQKNKYDAKRKMITIDEKKEKERVSRLANEVD